MTNLQAAIGCGQLESIGRIVSERRRIRARYAERLSHTDGILPQRVQPDVDPVFWSCAVRLDPLAFPQSRDGVISQLAEAGIETRPGFYAASLIDLYQAASLPRSEAISRQVLSLPTYPSLSDDHIALVCDRITSLRK
jgi:perosamine synthetase